MAQLTCGYPNSSDRMVIVRCLGPKEFFLERVVFPFELLSFLAPAESVVQIWTHGLGGPELCESVAVEELCTETTSPMGAPRSISGLTGAVQEWQQAS